MWALLGSRIKQINYKKKLEKNWKNFNTDWVLSGNNKLQIQKVFTSYRYKLKYL